MKTLDLDLRDAGLYNAVINGNMDFWQRGTTITRTQATNITGYLADRQKCGIGGATAKSVTINKSTQVPSSSMPSQTSCSYEIVNNTAVATYTASDYIAPLYHAIEGNIFQPLYGKDFTIGAWVYSSISIPVFPISFTSSTNNFSYVTTVSLSIGWSYVSAVIPWNANITALDQNIALVMYFGWIGGTSFQAGSLNSWVAGNLPTHASATNWASGSGVTIRVTQIQMRSGQWASSDMQNSFQRTGVDFQREWQLCQRYYEAVPGTNIGSRAQYLHNFYKTTKRAIPTLTLVSGSLGGSNLGYGLDGLASFRCPESTVGASTVDWIVSADADF